MAVIIDIEKPNRCDKCPIEQNDGAEYWCGITKSYTRLKNRCDDCPLKEVSQEPILDKIRAEIESKCDRINSLASVLPYTAHREIQELLCEIMKLIKAESEVLEDGKID